jgi:hypothetical protein
VLTSPLSGPVAVPEGDLRMKIATMALILSVLMVGGSSKASAITISLDPTSQTLGLGSLIEVDLRVSDLGNFVPPSLSTFDLDVLFDPAILSFNSVSYGDPVLGGQLDIFGLGSLTLTTPSIGSVNLFELSFDSAADLNNLQVGAFVLATLSFDTLAIGVSPLSVLVNVLGDADAAPLNASASGGSVTVNPSVIPEPASLLLVGAGLLAVIRRRRLRSAD